VEEETKGETKQETKQSVRSTREMGSWGRGYVGMGGVGDLEERSGYMEQSEGGRGGKKKEKRKKKERKKKEMY